MAAAPDGQVIYVGNENVTSGGYWTTDSNGNVTPYTGEGTPTDNYIYYDANDNILTLHNATIKKGLDYNTSIEGGTLINDSAIGVLNQHGNAELTIQLEGSNTIAEVSQGIYVLAHSQSTGSSSLTITGNGSLDTSGSQFCIRVQSNSSDAALSIKNAKVTATVVDGYGGNGVFVQSSENSSVSLTVNSGSLTATGRYANDAGILLQFGSGASGSGTPTVTVSNNAIVRANGGIANNSSTSIQYGTGSDSTGGIVWNGSEGTVYGKVTLDENLTIGEGESLTIPEGSSLNTNVNTITVESGGALTGEPDGTVVYAPAITAQPQDKTVTEGTTAGFSVMANGSEPLSYQWQYTTNNGQSWTEISGATGSTYTAEATTTSMSGTQYQCVVSNSAGSVTSNAATLTVNSVPVTGVTLDTDKLDLFTGNSATLNAMVAPDDATNQAVTWSSDNTNVATVESGNVTAVGAGTATITVTTEDGQKTAACTVTVTDKTYTISADTTALDFGSAYTGYAQPASKTVTVKNTGNQPVTLNQPVSTDNFEVGALSTTTLATGETATFTVQPKAGLSAGTYSDTITINGTGGAAVTIPASFTVKSRPSYNPPTVSEETTDAIQESQPGETVTVDLSSGSIKLDKEVFEALAGKDVTLVVDLGDGVSWTVKGSDVPEDADFTDIDMGVTMNSHGIPVDIINAITGERGSVQMTLAHNGAFGFTMTLTAPLGAENAGYWANLYHFKVNDGEAGKMTFETAAKIGDDGSVSLSFSHASQYAIVIDDHNHGVIELPFTDVNADDWFYDPVCFVYSQGLMTGTSDTTFEPNTPLSRAMLVAVLHRLEGSPQASGGDFTDVADGDWYAQAVNWAASVGVVNGMGDGNFQPNAAITREQMAAILRNYAAYKGMDVTTSGDLSTYSDAASVSTWAKDSVVWAVGSGLIGGYEDSTLRPQGTTTRAEVASVLQRYLEK